MIKIASLYKNDNINFIIKHINSNSLFPEFRDKLPVQELDYLKPNKYLVNAIETNLKELDEVTFIKYLKAIESDYRRLFASISLPVLDCKTSAMSSLSKPLIGRDEELKLLEIFMNRKYKNNVILVGEPGVGKTALIREYTKKTSKPIIEVNLSDILSDTKYRGEFEKKLTNIIKETIEKERILFIDEIHILIQAGGVEGGISASNILKPFLTEEHFQIIGATTKEESKYFSEDRALERRFNFLHLPELPKEVLYKMFCKELSELENNELKNQAQMCEEFERLIKKLDLILPQRNYPDKLLDFLDFFGSYIKICGHDTIQNALNFFEKTVNSSNIYGEEL